MKKITTIILSLVATATAAFATFDDDKPITFEQLPDAAKEFIHKHFNGEQVSQVVLDNDILDNEYTVVFASGAKLEFNGDGSWKELDSRTKQSIRASKVQSQHLRQVFTSRIMSSMAYAKRAYRQPKSHYM